MPNRPKRGTRTSTTKKKAAKKPKKVAGAFIRGLEKKRKSA